jgi:hypothetical protein
VPLALEGDGNVVERLQLLMTGSPRGGRALQRAVMLMAIAMATLTVALIAALPAVASAGAHSVAVAHPFVHCPT